MLRKNDVPLVIVSVSDCFVHLDFTLICQNFFLIMKEH